MAGEVTNHSCRHPPSLWRWLLCSGKSFAQPVPAALYLEPAAGLVLGSPAWWPGQGKAECMTVPSPFHLEPSYPCQVPAAGLETASLLKVPLVWLVD